MVSSLDYLNEKGGTILEWLRKNLKQIALLIEVHENIQLSNHIEVLSDFSTHITKSLGQVVVVGGRNGQELAASIFHSRHRVYDAICSQSYVLHAGTSVVIDVLLNLRLLLGLGWLVDWHFHVLIEVTKNNRAQSRVLGVKHLVID